ncbi:sensor histidine kinase [Streptomyces yaizuensis]|uniref:histidine kinase n=1 Tax=Streptomyces yaizuensis TaxID=2989713 RepID=A0ABQ5P6M1_9ACTN|nr:HAMP domain-containing sensor histidine kinase [Streptomyces sp. YSPA8]GLF97881.1 HAMP domain-containing histidine kinase [Streptomyces sp. YSPA8]
MGRPGLRRPGLRWPFRPGLRWLPWRGLRRPGRTRSIHTRLFLGFAGALAASAVLMVAVIYTGMRFVPTYDFRDTLVVKGPGTVERLPRTWESFPEAGMVPGATPGTPVDRSIRSKEDVWNTLLRLSTGGLLLVMAIGLAVGWRLSKRLLAPLGTVSQAAARAAEGQLQYRINAEGPADELKQLADTFDTMLARLEESFAAHRRFAANASHELLTPLATTRAVLQLAAADPGGEEFAELVPMLVETNERNITIVQALLDLAAADHAPFDPDPVDLAALATDAAAERAARAAATGLRLDIDTEPGCTVPGNTTLLRQLLLNLLDNALAYNRPGGSVHLAVLRENGIVIEVENTGPRIDGIVAQRLFEPFYRQRSRVTSDRSGHGLGLAIVRSIVHAHHGTVTAHANPDGGLTVRAELPPGPGRGPRSPSAAVGSADSRQGPGEGVRRSGGDELPAGLEGVPGGAGQFRA